jgi:hypothetical protein
MERKYNGSFRFPRRIKILKNASQNFPGNIIISSMAAMYPASHNKTIYLTPFFPHRQIGEDSAMTPAFCRKINLKGYFFLRFSAHSAGNNCFYKEINLIKRDAIFS